MNVFKEMALSIYSFDSYSDFLENRKGKVFGFGLLLMLIYFLITMLIPSVLTFGTPSQMARNIQRNMPDFELKDGTLWVDEVVDLDAGTTYIYIDTDPDYVFYDADEIEDYLDDYYQAILVDSEKIIVKNGGEMQGIYFSDLDMDLDKDDLVELVPYFYVLVIIFMIFAYIWMTALFFFGVLFVALLGMIVASALNYQITIGQLYLLGIYSRTLPLLIKALVSYLPVGIPFFWVINFGLSVFILAMVIRKMKDNEPQNPTGYNYSGYTM